MTKLPEKYRQARNIKRGYEVHAKDDGWVRVSHVLNIVGPVAVTVFTLANGTEASVSAQARVLSRRSGGAS